MSNYFKRLSLILAGLLFSSLGKAANAPVIDYDKLDKIWAGLVTAAKNDYGLLIGMSRISKQDLEGTLNCELTEQEALIVQELINKLLCEKIDLEVVHIKDLPLSTQEYLVR